MTEQERIKDIEERITLEGLLPGVNLDSLPPGDSAQLKRAVLDLYRLGHASGFKAGADHAMKIVAGLIPQLLYVLQMQWLMRWLSVRMREYLRDFKKSLRWIRAMIGRSQRLRRFPTIRAMIVKSQRLRRFPSEALSGIWAIRR
jgi:hypothetical protein